MSFSVPQSDGRAVQQQTSGQRGSSPSPESVLHGLRAAETNRQAARAGLIQVSQRAALRDVVGQLLMLLDLAAESLSMGVHRSASGESKRDTERRLAASVVTSMPLADLAKLLGTDEQQVEVVLRVLRRDGDLDEMQVEALDHIEVLRTQLQAIVENDDHVLLGALVEYGVKIAQALVIATTATMAGTAIVGESIDSSTLIKGAIIAFVGVALQDAISLTYKNLSPAIHKKNVRSALNNLTSDISHYVNASTAGAALDPTVDRIRLLIKVYQVDQALLHVEGADKEVCQNILRRLDSHLRRAQSLEASQLAYLNKRLNYLRSWED